MNFSLLPQMKALQYFFFNRPFSSQILVNPRLQLFNCQKSANLKMVFPVWYPYIYNPAFDNSLGMTFNRLTLCIMTNISLTFCLLTIKSLTSFRVTEIFSTENPFFDVDSFKNAIYIKS